MHRTESHLLDILVPLWPRIAGRTMAEHSQPAFFASGVLTLNADCAAWGTQLRHMADEIRAKINRFLGQPIVKKLRVKTVTQPDLFAPPRLSHATGLPAPPPVKPQIDMGSIADPDIAALLAGSYAKYFNRPRR